METLPLPSSRPPQPISLLYHHHFFLLLFQNWPYQVWILKSEGILPVFSSEVNINSLLNQELLPTRCLDYYAIMGYRYSCCLYLSTVARPILIAIFGINWSAETVIMPNIWSIIPVHALIHPFNICMTLLSLKFVCTYSHPLFTFYTALSTSFLKKRPI